jgi:hypothetical protein
MDKRAGFFLGAAVLCFLLVPVADPGHRWVAVATGVVYLLLTVLSALDRRSRSRTQPRPPLVDLFVDEEQSAPFEHRRSGAAVPPRLTRPPGPARRARRRQTGSQGEQAADDGPSAPGGTAQTDPPGS